MKLRILCEDRSSKSIRSFAVKAANQINEYYRVAKEMDPDFSSMINSMLSMPPFPDFEWGDINMVTADIPGRGLEAILIGPNGLKYGVKLKLVNSPSGGVGMTVSDNKPGIMVRVPLRSIEDPKELANLLLNLIAPAFNEEWALTHANIDPDKLHALLEKIRSMSIPEFKKYMEFSKSTPDDIRHVNTIEAIDNLLRAVISREVKPDEVVEFEGRRLSGKNIEEIIEQFEMLKPFQIETPELLKLFKQYVNRLDKTLKLDLPEESISKLERLRNALESHMN